MITENPNSLPTITGNTHLVIICTQASDLLQSNVDLTLKRLLLENGHIFLLQYPLPSIKIADKFAEVSWSR